MGTDAVGISNLHDSGVLSDVQGKQLDRVVTLLREVLGPDVLGVYLFGSAVLGGLRPSSDLDVLAVSRRHAAREEKRRLIDHLLAISHAGGPLGTSRRIELTIVVESDIRPWRYPPNVEFQYGDWLRPQFESGIVEAWPATSPDIASLITMVLVANTPLFGPPPGEIFDAIPRSDQMTAMVDGVDALLGDLGSDTRNVVLTLARIWFTLATGDISSKDHAADWALARLPDEHQEVLARATAIYLGRAEERWDDIRPRVSQYADYVVREIEQLHGASRPELPSMEDEEMWRRVRTATVARMASSGANGQPHIVPITFAIDGKVLYFAVDDKPKRTTDLKRLRNIAANPAVSILIDHYADDWTTLWWVRLDGDARILEAHDEKERALDLLAVRYLQYRTNRPKGPVVAVAIGRISGWSAAESRA